MVLNVYLKNMWYIQRWSMSTCQGSYNYDSMHVSYELWTFWLVESILGYLRVQVMCELHERIV